MVSGLANPTAKPGSVKFTDGNLPPSERFFSSEQAIPPFWLRATRAFPGADPTSYRMNQPVIAGIEAMENLLVNRDPGLSYLEFSVEKWSYFVVGSREAEVKIAGFQATALDIAQRFVL